MVFDNLYNSSFRGVPFLIAGESTLESGRKGVTHEFPLTSRRVFEDLGRFQDKFSIIGIIHGSGQEYFQLRDRLRSALDEEGIGILVHGLYGSVNVINKLFTIKESQTTLGKATFSMAFERVEAPVFPIQTTNNKNLLVDRSQDVIDSIKEDFIDIYNVTRTSFINFNDAVDKFNKIAEALTIDNIAVPLNQENVSIFNASLEKYIDNIIQNIFKESDQADNLFTTLNDFNNVAENPTNQIEISSDLFDFGDDDTEIDTTTLNRQERETNRKIINSVVRSVSLMQNYITTTQVTFKNDEQLNGLRASLEEQYNSINNNSNLSDATLTKILNARNELRIFLNNQLLNVSRVTTIKTNSIPYSVLSYTLYGNSDNTDAIIDLNNANDALVAKGTIKILSL